MTGAVVLISDEYRALNRAMYGAKPNYGSSGHRWVTFAHDLALVCDAETLLDYGCGRGTLKAALEAASPLYRIFEYDPAISGKETKPAHADVVVCGDVLEHVEPECLDAVLDDICGIARRGVFFVVATGPAQKTLPDGRNAHLIVEPPGWWLPQLMARWDIQMFRNFKNGFLMSGFAAQGKD